MANTWLIANEETILRGVNSNVLLFDKCAPRQIEIGVSSTDTEHKLTKQIYLFSCQNEMRNEFAGQQQVYIQKPYQRVKS